MLRHPAFPDGQTRQQLIDWYRRERARTKAIFSIVAPAAYYDRPIGLRNPIVFYEGHLPAFAVNTVLKLTLGERGIDEAFEVLFARGIDPESEDAIRDPTDVWPARSEVRAYGTVAEALIERTLAEGDVERAEEAIFTIFEHEQMHQETLLYMLHNLPYEKKVAIAPLHQTLLPSARGEGARSADEGSLTVRIPRGTATLGASHEEQGFGWDNEFQRFIVDVDEFEIDVHNVTNGDYLRYVEATGAHAPHFWARVEDQWFRRDLFALTPLPLDAPVYVTFDEAAAYARWAGGRLPTEAEYHRAAFGTPDGMERQHPWGDEPPDSTRGNFDFASWDPVDVGSQAAGASAWGVHDLVGNGWEWTSSPFAPFPGFQPMPSYLQYSTDFFDGQHYVLKGASPVTAKELVRRSFRNWFRPAYPYVYATFRCVR